MPLFFSENEGRVWEVVTGFIKSGDILQQIKSPYKIVKLKER